MLCLQSFIFLRHLVFFGLQCFDQFGVGVCQVLNSGLQIFDCFGQLVVLRAEVNAIKFLSLDSVNELMHVVILIGVVAGSFIEVIHLLGI